MKSILTAVVMFMVLFCYGYFVTSIGHDHGSHEKTHAAGGQDHSGHGEHDHQH